MTQDLFLEAVNKFRGTEEEYNYTSVILLGNREAQQLLVAWSTYPVKFKDPHLPPPDPDDNLVWDHLWKHVQVDLVLLGNRSGLTESQVGKWFEPLRAAHLIYPDGRISETGKSLLSASVLPHLSRAMK